jgi:UDP-N-acetylmuramoyl-L-alanyl-D-glutamate--2,6-diaminopimelate ligase
MLLAELVHSLALLQQSGSLDREITGIAYDSRQVQPGFLFVAIPGYHVDGHNFLADAATRGAVAAVIQRQVAVPKQLSWVQVADTRKALAILAQVFFGHPARKLRLVGVTGTNGKTTTTLLLHSILSYAGYGVGVIGTVKTIVGKKEYPVKHTTPEAADLQAYLAEMLAARSHYAVMEVSSHALALERVLGLEFDVGVFTNLTQDHLDFHQSMDAYLQAKGRLFSSLHLGHKPNKAAILNADDPALKYLLQQTKVPVITYGLNEEANFQARDIRIGSSGTSFELLVRGQLQGNIWIVTPGLFTVYNALAAISVAVHEGIPLPLIAEALAIAPSIPGRFQPVRLGQEFEVVVDYAHTPDGLQNILTTARQFCSGRVILVFGCGGDRDRRKRPLMGEIANQLADMAIVTSDNPRSEDPQRIAEDTLVGMPDRRRVLIELDRAAAIRLAIGRARAGDVVIIAGKGHETYQIFADRTIHFDDREVAKRALEDRRNDEMGVTDNS